MPQRYLNVINDKIQEVDNSMEKSSQRLLTKMQRQEEKLFRKIARKDSALATRLLNDSREKYVRLKSALASSTKKKLPYIPYLDSLKTSLQFVEQGYAGGLSKLINEAELKQSLKIIGEFESRLIKTEQIKTFIKERKKLLKEKLGDLPMVKELQHINKQIYYYHAQLTAYKEILKDQHRIEQEAMRLLRQLPVYQQFVRDNSRLASLFRLPSINGGSGGIDPATLSEDLRGLQTRDMIQEQLGRMIASGGPNGAEILEQRIQSVQSRMQGLKNKINEVGGGVSESDTPDFKPNQEKTKSFFKRLDFGINVQSNRSNSYFPTTSDIGFSLGYKLSETSALGIGTSYRIGWGRDIRHIQITHERVGLRTFMDVKVTGSFYFTGGYEQNFRSAFNNIGALEDKSKWEQSGLIGINKKYKLSKKSNGSMQLLYDLFWKEHAVGKALVFRVGYIFN
ncbi:MAG TPA: hypothetical protein VIK89_07855 [Cytophagaceae bacterium]